MADYLVPIVGYLRFDTTQGIASLAAVGTAVEGVTKATSAAAKTNTAAMKQWNKDTADATGAVTTGLLAVGVGAVAAAAGAVKMAADFETSTNMLVTSAGFAKQDIGQLRQGILDMSSQVGDSAMDLSHAMYTVGSAGITQVGPALEVLRAGAEGAKAENADLSTVLNAVTSAMADYHLGADQSAMVTTKLIAAVSVGKTTFQDLTGSMHSVLPIASAMHVPLSDILGALASMTEHGMSADEATQNLAHTLQHLQTTTAPQQKELALLGLNVRQLADDLGNPSVGLTGVLQQISTRIQDSMGPDKQHVVLDMATALKGLPPAVQQMGEAVINGSMSIGDFTKSAKGLSVEQAGLVHQFATLMTSTHGIGSAQQSGAQVMQTYAAALKAATGDSTTLNTALMLTGENADATNKAVAHVAGATTEAGNRVAGWASIQATFNQKLAESKDGLEAAAIKMDERLLPMATQLLGYLAAHIPDLEALGNKLVDVALAVGKFVQWISPAIPLIATAVGLFIAWRTAMTIGTAIEGVATMIQAFAATMAILSAAEGEATVAQWLLNVAMDANPIGLVVLGVALLIAGLVLLVTHWNQVTAALRAFGGLVEGVILHAIQAVITAFVDWAGWSRDLVPKTFGQIPGDIAAILVTIGLEIRARLRILGADIQGVLTGAWNGVLFIFRAGVAGAVAIVSGFANAVVGLFSWLYNHNYYFKFLVDSIRLTFEKARDDAVAIWTTITTWLGARWQWVSDRATSIWTAITTAIGDKLNEAWSAITSVWNRITGWLGGVWDQIASDAGRLWGVVSSVIGAQVHEAWNTITNVFGSLGGWFADRAGDAYNWGYNLIQAIGRGIGAAAGAIAAAVRSIGGVIADWLGFHSPTKLGPGAEADLWAPAFVRMYAAGLEAGAPRIASASAVLMGGLVRPTPLGGYGGGLGGADIASSGTSALSAPAIGGMGLDDTNDLLHDVRTLLMSIDQSLKQRQRFSNAAYRPA